MIIDHHFHPPPLPLGPHFSRASDPSAVEDIGEGLLAPSPQHTAHTPPLLSREQGTKLTAAALGQPVKGDRGLKDN